MATNNSNYELIETDFLNGQVKWFNNKLNYGFITIISDTEHKGKDIFVHQTNIIPETSEYRTLTQGEYVSFYLAKTKDSTKHEFQLPSKVEPSPPPPRAPKNGLTQSD